jgi:magnesium transporter
MTDTAERPLAPEISAAALEDFALGEDYALNPRFVAMVVDAADRGDLKRLRELVTAVSPPDVADLMGFLSAEHREDLVPLLAPDVLAEVLPELDDHIRDEVLEQVAPGVSPPPWASSIRTTPPPSSRTRTPVDGARCWPPCRPATARDRDHAGLRRGERRPADAARGAGGSPVLDRRADARPRPRFRRAACRAVLRRLRRQPQLQGAWAASRQRLIKARPDAALASIMEPVTEIEVGQDQEKSPTSSESTT